MVVGLGATDDGVSSCCMLEDIVDETAYGGRSGG